MNIVLRRNIYLLFLSFANALHRRSVVLEDGSLIQLHPQMDDQPKPWTPHYVGTRGEGLGVE